MSETATTVEQKQLYQAIGRLERVMGLPKGEPKVYKITVKIGDHKPDYIQLTIFQSSKEAWQNIQKMTEGQIVKVKALATTQKNDNLFLKGKDKPYYETQLFVTEITDTIPY